jgi:glycosyltransferase involved in cell wall biosynthesis
MRIGIVTETYSPEINGVALTVAGLARGLAGAGHSVHVVRPRQKSDAGTGNRDERIATTLVRGMRLPRYPGLQFGLPAARRLCALWRRERPEALYIATEGPLGWSALRAARALGIPAATGFHTRFDDFARHYGLGVLTSLVFAWLRRFHRRSAATLVPTVELAEFLSGKGFGNVVRLPRAVDTNLFHPERRDEALRAHWGAANGRPVVIYVGRIAAEKNLELAVRTYRAIEQSAPGARYVWVGDGPARASLAAGNPDFVFAGVRRGADLARHFASADLFVFPSLTETFGNVTLEALASGVPTVAFDYGAAREHLNDFCGRRIAPDAPDAFVAAACELATFADDGMRKAARAAVAALDPHSVTQAFAQMLAALAAGEKPQVASAPAQNAAGAHPGADEPDDERLARSTP